MALRLGEKLFFDDALFLFELLHVFPGIALFVTGLPGEVEFFALQHHAVLAHHVGGVLVRRRHVEQSVIEFVDFIVHLQSRVGGDESAFDDFFLDARKLRLEHAFLVCVQFIQGSVKVIRFCRHGFTCMDAMIASWGNCHVPLRGSKSNS